MKLNVSLAEFFAATPAEVWESLIDPETLADWLMPNDFVAEVGREFTLVPDHPTPWEGPVECRVLQLLPRKRMVWSWRTHGMEEPSRVEFELVAKPGGTELRFRHAGEAQEPVTRGLKGGWPDMLDRLVSGVQERTSPHQQRQRVGRRR